jgi:hypothetical protein
VEVEEEAAEVVEEEMEEVDLPSMQQWSLQQRFLLPRLLRRSKNLMTM